MMEEMSHHRKLHLHHRRLHHQQKPEEFGLRPTVNIGDSLFDDITINSVGNCELRELESVLLPALLPNEHLIMSRSISPQPMVRSDPLDAVMSYRQQPTVLKRSRGDLISNDPHVLGYRRPSDNAFSVVSVGENEHEQTQLSPQSFAARQRRKRISNKTQELGKLVPGGHKMSTAEMFQAAGKYVKFLQAQVGILSMISPPVEGSGRGGEKQLQQQLLSTTAIQEKLYQIERCIVPNRTVEGLANDPFVKSHPFISRDLERFTTDS